MGGGGCNNVHVDTFLIRAFVTSKTFLLLRFELFHVTSATFLLLRFELFHVTSKTFLLLRFELFHLTSKTFLCKDNAAKKTCLVSDGAPCYPKLPRKTKVLHYSCNHSKGIFCLKKGRRDGSTLLVHTGSIDGMRKLAKQAIHNSLNTCINGSVNPKLLQGVRVFQWRWQNNDKNDLMSVTGHALSKRLRS